MASFMTNRGKYRMIRGWFAAQSVPTTFYMPLFTGATTPTVDTNTFSELTEIAAGNGYTSGGIAVARNTTDFDVFTEDDTNDRALVQIKDLVWTASGGSLPGSGSGARWACLTDDNGTMGSRDILLAFDLAADRTVTVGQTLTLQDCELRVTE